MEELLKLQLIIQEALRRKKLKRKMEEACNAHGQAVKKPANQAGHCAAMPSNVPSSAGIVRYTNRVREPRTTNTGEQ